MSSNEITLPSRAPQPTRIAQATAVEQSRAVAEVQAAVLVAQQCPRDVQAAIASMRVSCGLMGLAERAFFRYNRAGSQITGPTVHLARELARVWGNIDYGFKELSRESDRSEMLAFAWDQETNARNSISVIVPHGRDTTKGVKELTELRDIYENNANNAARRLRQTIWAVLPPWFVDEAVELCRATLKRGADDGQPVKPLPTRIANMLAAFTSQRVTEEDLARKLGRPSSKWTEHDLADLGVIYKSIERGETTRDAEFPPAPVSPEDIAAARPAEPPAPAPVADADRELAGAILDTAAAVGKAVLGDEYPAASADQPSVSAAPAELRNKVKDQLYRIGVTKPRDQLDVISRVDGETTFTRWGDLTTSACAAAADLLVKVGHHEPEDRLNALDALLGELEDARESTQDGQ